MACHRRGGHLASLRTDRADRTRHLPRRAVLRARLARRGAGVLRGAAGDRAASDAHRAGTRDRDRVNVLAIDQGTSATKALLVGPGNEVLGSAEVPVRTVAVDGDGVEAD